MRFIWLLILLTACAGGTKKPEHYLAERGLSSPTQESVLTCRGYGCKHVALITPTASEWRSIEKPFRTRIKTPEAERTALAQAIAAFETVIGNYNETSQDIGGTFQKTGHTQQDCVDESINTTIYLQALYLRGNLKFHSVGSPQSRVPFMKWPHQTATIIENESKTRFVVDSWFHDNGHAPEIIDFETWKKGWKPEN